MIAKEQSTQKAKFSADNGAMSGEKAGLAGVGELAKPSGKQVFGANDFVFCSPEIEFRRSSALQPEVQSFATLG